MSFQVQFITHFTETLSYLDSVRIALEGGCRWIQLRMKDAPEDEVRAAAGKALPLCRLYGATLILDDHVELAKSLNLPLLGMTAVSGSSRIAAWRAQTDKARQRQAFVLHPRYPLRIQAYECGKARF